MAPTISVMPVVMMPVAPMMPVMMMPMAPVMPMVPVVVMPMVPVMPMVVPMRLCPRRHDDEAKNQTRQNRQTVFHGEPLELRPLLQGAATIGFYF
jgi:hypothetical protein